jgi:hypothetical protein
MAPGTVPLPQLWGCTQILVITPAAHGLCPTPHPLPAIFLTGADLLVLPGRQTYVFDRTGKCLLSFNSQLDTEKHVSEALAALATVKSVA